MAQVAADAFGIHPDDVSVRHGDTGTTPLSSGTVGARGASYTVAAIAEAAAALKAKMARYMIHDHGLEGASQDDFSFRDGAVVYEKDGNVRRAFAALADRIVMGSINLPPGETPGLEHTAYFEAPKAMICFTAQAAKVEVDIETGRFVILDYATCEDVGTVINPIVVEGQVQGGVVQGMSNAMFEEFLYDENGQQLTADFENYRLASAADVPQRDGRPFADTMPGPSAWGSRGGRRQAGARAGGARQRHLRRALTLRRRNHDASAQARDDPRRDRGRPRPHRRLALGSSPVDARPGSTILARGAPHPALRQRPASDAGSDHGSVLT